MMRVLLGLVFLAAWVEAPAAVHPRYEGGYEIRMTSGGETTPAILLLVNHGDNVLLSIHDAKYGIPRYRFEGIRTEGDGRHLEASGLPFGSAAEWVSDIEGETLRATIRSGSGAGDVTVTGKLLASGSKLYVPQPVDTQIGLLELAGDYQVSSPSTGTLTLRQPLGGGSDLVGAYHIRYARIDFVRGRWIPEQGVLELTTAGGSDGFLKWVLAVRRGQRGALVASGIAYSTVTGKWYPVSLTRSRNKR